MVGPRHILDPRLASVTDQNEGQSISVWAAELIHAGSFARFAGPRPFPRFLNCDGIACDRIVAPDFRFWLNRHYVKCAVSIDCPHSAERVGRTGSVRHARLNTQRKILETMWMMWLRQKPFDPARFAPIEKDSWCRSGTENNPSD